jgi:septum formation protein
MMSSSWSLFAPLVLASRSPRRRELLQQAGYQFDVMPADESVECGICSGESPPELVARLAWRKAENIALRLSQGIVIGCDTVAECHGQILGKPVDRDHAGRMLRMLRGQKHRVYSGLCVWRRPDDRVVACVEVSTLTMDALDEAQIEAYLNTDQWEGKAGAFGFQDGLGWVQLLEGSASNVVGLPMEALSKLLAELGEDDVSAAR